MKVDVDGRQWPSRRLEIVKNRMRPTETRCSRTTSSVGDLDAEEVFVKEQALFKLALAFSSIT